MVDRALAGTYPPGSTFKPYMALAALQLGKRTPQYTINDPGYFQFGGHRFHDDKPGGHGVVDMYKSLVVSCDTYYYMLANDLGIDNIARFIGQFGFGAKTGIDIEGEATGVLPSPEWKRKRFSKPEQQKWYAGETISIGIGQGYNAYTPLQLAQAMATLANNGVMYRPHLVDYIENIRSGDRTRIEPKLVRTIPLKPENLEFIKRALAGVNIEGTGARAFAGAEYTSAGKTGTAQVVALRQNEKYNEKRVTERHRDHALFIAFAPLENPKIALAVVVENAGFGAPPRRRSRARCWTTICSARSPTSLPPRFPEKMAMIRRALKRGPGRAESACSFKSPKSAAVVSGAMRRQAGVSLMRGSYQQPFKNLWLRFTDKIDAPLFALAFALLVLGFITPGERRARYAGPHQRPGGQYSGCARGDVGGGATPAADADALSASHLCARARTAGRSGAVRRRRQRRAPLAQPRRHPHPAFGNHENRDAADARLVFSHA